MKKVIIRKNGSKRILTVNQEPSKTDQQWKEDCDVNNIIRKFLKTGQINHLNHKQGSYADVSEIPDLLEATMQIQQASDLFSDLPSQVRKRFNNSPLDMIDFLKNPENFEEAQELGLLNSRIETSVSTGNKPEGALAPPTETPKETKPKSEK